MNFEATTGQPVLVDQFQSVFHELSSGCDDRDKRKKIGNDEIRKMAATGIFGLGLPHEFGGKGGALSDIVEVVRSVARIDAGVALIVGTHNILSFILYKCGLLEQQNSAVLAKIASGEHLISSALQEHGHSTIPDNLNASSVLHGENYELNGTKVWVPCGELAEFVVVSASSGNDSNQQNPSFYFVEKSQDGIDISPHEEPLGLRSANLCQLQLQHCTISSANKLDDRINSLIETGMYLMISALALGIAETVLERSRIYASQRRQFDQPIGNFEAIRDKLAEMAVSMESVSALLNNTVKEWESGKISTKSAAVSKLAASRAAMFSSNEALQIHGGYGYLRENEIERFLRDAKMTGIYAVPNENAREIIARELLKPDSQ